MERLQKVISVIEMEYNASEKKIKEKYWEIESIQTEYSKLQSAFFESNLREKNQVVETQNLKKLIEHYEGERNDLMVKYNAYSDTLKKVKCVFYLIGSIRRYGGS